MKFEKAASPMQDKHNAVEMLSHFYYWNITEL